MDMLILNNLISPISKEKLSYEDENEILTSVLSKEKFKLLYQIPILIPSTDVADYSNNILEILYGEKTKEIEDYYYDKYKGDPYIELTKKIKKDFDKDLIISKFIEYSKLENSEKLKWLIKVDKYNKQISKASILKGFSYTTVDNGKKRIEITKEMKVSWAIHLDDYAKLVTESNPKFILELATGAGIGTCGIIESGLKNSKLYTIDIDFDCVCNAKGIAKYCNLEKQVIPVVANFWYLPFKNNSMDMICSHYGLDESREITRIIEEVSRVLKKDGNFVLITRKDPSIRLKQTLDGFNFTYNELIYLAKLGGLFSGLENLINIAKTYNLKLDFINEYSPKNSHDRILYRFVKNY